jgi:hypothetical protein
VLLTPLDFSSVWLPFLTPGAALVLPAFPPAPLHSCPTMTAATTSRSIKSLVYSHIFCTHNKKKSFYFPSKTEIKISCLTEPENHMRS